MNKEKLNVVIPMAGAGSRFEEAGYNLPKPLIDVKGKRMIEWVIDSLCSVKLNINFIFIAQEEHLNLGLREYLKDKGSIITVNSITEGAASTVLLAKDLINNNEELVIANCDQYLTWSFYDYITHSRLSEGSLVTFNSTNPHHSYVKLKKQQVIEVAEKIVISDRASAGIYYFKKGSDFIKGAQDMIDKNIRTNNEFYICPVYNELIPAKQISIYDINVFNKHMLGTPEELNIFLDKIDNEEITL